MNLSLATDSKAPASLLDALIGYIAAGIAAVGERFGLRTLAADGNAAVAQAIKVRIRQSGSMASALAPASASHSSTNANDQYGRFQREIVPHLDAAYNFARFLSRNPDAAQDIVQEAFLRAYRRFDGYQGGDARAWIFSIVRNCYHNWLLEGRRKARVEIDGHRRDGAGDFSIDDVASDEDTPESALLRSSEAGQVRDVLNRLPRSSREVLVLRELEGLSYRQIAEALALPIGTVMSRLARGRTQFEIAWRAEATIREEQR